MSASERDPTGFAFQDRRPTVDRPCDDRITSIRRTVVLRALLIAALIVLILPTLIILTAVTQPEPLHPVGQPPMELRPDLVGSRPGWG